MWCNESKCIRDLFIGDMDWHANFYRFICWGLTGMFYWGNKSMQTSVGK